MKINWGHKIAAVYILFAGFMIFMLFLSKSEKHELVTENYYENEVAVQGKLDAGKALANSEYVVLVTENKGNVELLLTGLQPDQKATGEVKLYKPDDANLDEAHPLHIDADGKMIIHPRGTRGRYLVQVSFSIGETSYYKEQQIVL